MQYMGVGLRFCTAWDPRERNGYIANCVAAVIFTIVWIALLTDSQLVRYNYHNSVYCDPITGLCF